jgi:hypothetical protein
VCLVLVGLRAGFLALLEGFLHHLREIFREECPVLTRALDVGDVVLVPAVLLHQLRGGGRDLHLVVRNVSGRCGGGHEILDVLEKNLAVLASARDGLDVDAVVPRELLRTRGGVDLLLRGLGEALEVLHRDLVVGSSALEVVRNGDALGFCEVLGRLAGEARDLLLLRGLEKLLREETLVREELDSVSAVAGFRHEELVDDHREVLRRGRHLFRSCSVGCWVHPPLRRGSKLNFFLQLQKKVILGRGGAPRGP